MADYIPRSSLDAPKKEELRERKKLEAVVSEAPKPKKKTLWDKVKEQFINEDRNSIGEYLILDVIVPAIKKTLQETVNNGVDMLLYGETTGRRNSNLPANRVSYRNYYDNRANDRYSAPRPSAYGYEEIVFASRGDAEAVKYRMQEIIDQYQVVRVADYLELSDRPSGYTDNNYGWTTDQWYDVRIIRDRSGGYFLDLPRPVALD